MADILVRGPLFLFHKMVSLRTLALNSLMYSKLESTVHDSKYSLEYTNFTTVCVNIPFVVSVLKTNFNTWPVLVADNDINKQQKVYSLPKRYKQIRDLLLLVVSILKSLTVFLITRKQRKLSRVQRGGSLRGLNIFS